MNECGSWVRLWQGTPGLCPVIGMIWKEWFIGDFDRTSILGASLGDWDMFLNSFFGFAPNIVLKGNKKYIYLPVLDIVYYPFWLRAKDTLTHLTRPNNFLDFLAAGGVLFIPSYTQHHSPYEHLQIGSWDFLCFELEFSICMYFYSLKWENAWNSLLW